jgi:hypothetical protein
VEGVKLGAIPVLGLTLLVLAPGALAQDWHRVASPFCSQIKAKGAKVSSRPFSVFEAASADSKCCADLDVTLTGRTEQYGYFNVAPLSKGHRYFLVFDLKTKQVIVPVEVDRLLGTKNCEPWSRVTVDKASDRITWEEWIVVD